MSLCPQTRRWRLRALAVVVLGFVMLTQGGSAWAAFKKTTGNSGSSWTTDTLDPVTNLGYTRACTQSAGSVPSYVGGATQVASGGNATVTFPAATATGDFLVLFSIITDSTTDNNANTPSGWTRQVDQYTTGANLRAFTRFVTGSEGGAVTLSGYDTSDHGAAALEVYRGVSTTTPIDAVTSAAYSLSSTWTTPSVTTTTANTRLVLGVHAQGSTSLTASGPTKRNAVVATTDLLQTLDATATSAGATGTRTGATSNSGRSIGATLALRAAPTVDGTVTVSWTPTVDTYATGYIVTRTPGGSSTIPNRTYTGGPDNSPAAHTAYSYSVTTYYGTWRSTSPSVSVPAC